MYTSADITYYGNKIKGYEIDGTDSTSGREMDGMDSKSGREMDGMDSKSEREMDGMNSTSGREMRISCSLSGKSEGDRTTTNIYAYRKIILKMGLRKKM